MMELSPGMRFASHLHSCGCSVSCTGKNNLGLGQVAGRAMGPEGLKCGQGQRENSLDGAAILESDVGHRVETNSEPARMTEGGSSKDR